MTPRETALVEAARRVGEAHADETALGYYQRLDTALQALAAYQRDMRQELSE